MGYIISNQQLKPLYNIIYNLIHFVILFRYKLSYTIIDNLRSSIREFIAMHQLSTGIPLLPHILANNIELNLARTPESSPSTPLSPKAKSHLLSEEATSNFETSMLHIPGITSTFNKYLKSKFNPSQLLAIMQSTTKKGFTLIQGPPGTGKTTTILGILNSIHIREHDNYYSNLLKTFLSHRGLDCHLHGDEKQWIELLTADAKHKPRILVVAPSNVAVDNIVERIIEKGFVDGTGKVYKPSMVRVGSGRSHRVLPVALDELVQKELQKELSLDAKKSLLEELNYNIYKLIPEAAKVQLFLLNLKKAFDAWNPLPRGWELRISQETTHPYWADHNMRLTCSVPPANHRELSSLSQGYKTLEELPAYQFYSKKFIDFLGQLDKLHSRRSHLQLLLQISSHSRDMISNSFSREAIENSIIDNAEILLTTINSCGHPSMESSEFCVTIVDEAVQCTEPSLLIALRKGCKQCVLVGDQNQLSATIYSPLVVQYNYQRSLFERLIDAGHSYLMLRTQYRMTPEISEFSSRMFYDSQLLDGSNVQQLNYLPPYISRNITSLPSNLNETFFEQQMKTFSTYQYYPILLPFIFFNLPHSQDTENELTLSKFNEIESHFCMKLLEFLAEELELYQKQIPTTKPLKLGSIGLITPYSDQLIQLQQLAKRLNMMASPASSSSSSNNSNPENENSDHSSNKNYNLDLEFNTVDGFQGKEKDMIIFSAVRANQEGNIGFLSDSRRMNVALTRGRYGVYIVGNASTLTNDPLWRDLVDYAKDRRAFINLPTHHIFSPRFSIRETILKHLSRFSLISDDVYYPLFDKMRELNQQKLEIIQQRKKRKREDQEEPLTIDNQQTVPPLPSAFDRNITNSYHEVLEDGEIIDEN